MIKLGDKVKDNVSGFKGIAISKHTYLQGCTRISIQPQIDQDGKLPVIESFDEPQLTIIEASKVKRKTFAFDPGGIEKYKDSPRETG